MIAVWSPTGAPRLRRAVFDPEACNAPFEEVEHDELTHPPRPRLPSLCLPFRRQATRSALPRADLQRPPRTWTFAVDLPSLTGKRATMRRGGYPTRKAATTALARVLDCERAGIWLDDRQTVADYLTTWLAEKSRMRCLWVPRTVSPCLTSAFRGVDLQHHRPGPAQHDRWLWPYDSGT